MNTKEMNDYLNFLKDQKKELDVIEEKINNLWNGIDEWEEKMKKHVSNLNRLHENI